jgi:hypothetical protein
MGLFALGWNNSEVWISQGRAIWCAAWRDLGSWHLVGHSEINLGVWFPCVVETDLVLSDVVVRPHLPFRFELAPIHTRFCDGRGWTVAKTQHENEAYIGSITPVSLREFGHNRGSPISSADLWCIPQNVHILSAHKPTCIV